jgi:hypothetical protein
LLIDVAKLLGLFAAIIAVLWLLRIALAQLTGALLPRLVESREVIDAELVARSRLYARITRSWGFLAVLGALVLVVLWRQGHVREGIIGFAAIGGAYAVDRRWPDRSVAILGVARGLVILGAIAYIGWQLLR